MGPYSFVEQVKRGINHTGGKGKKKEAEKKRKGALRSFNQSSLSLEHSIKSKSPHNNTYCIMQKLSLAIKHICNQVI